MSRSLGASPRAAALPGFRAVMSRRAVPAGLAGVSLLAAAMLVLFGRSPAVAATTCDLSATPSSFASQVSAASAGQTICLASGNYGTWQGTNKAITIRGASGSTPTMRVSLGSGDSGFTLDGVSGMGGTVSAGAANITIENSTFASQLDIEGALTNVVINNNSFTWPVESSNGGKQQDLPEDQRHARGPGRHDREQRHRERRPGRYPHRRRVW